MTEKGRLIRLNAGDLLCPVCGYHDIDCETPEVFLQHGEWQAAQDASCTRCEATFSYKFIRTGAEIESYPGFLTFCLECGGQLCLARATVLPSQKPVLISPDGFTLDGMTTTNEMVECLECGAASILLTFDEAFDDSDLHEQDTPEEPRSYTRIDVRMLPNGDVRAFHYTNDNLDLGHPSVEASFTTIYSSLDQALKAVGVSRRGVLCDVEVYLYTLYGDGVKI